MPMEFGSGEVVGSHPPFPASRFIQLVRAQGCTRGSLPEGPAGGTASPPQPAAAGAGLARGVHPKIKARLPFFHSPFRFCPPAPGAPVSQASPAQSCHQSGSDWSPRQGTTGALKREYSSLFILHVRHRTQTAVWVGKKPKAFCQTGQQSCSAPAPGSFTLLMAQSIKELKALLFEPRRPEAYLKKIYI